MASLLSWKRFQNVGAVRHEARRSRCLRPPGRRMLAGHPTGRPRDLRRSLMQQGKDLRAGRNHWTATRKASGASGVLGDGPMLNRRSMMKGLGLGAAGSAVPGLVAGCSSSSGGATRIVFEETKPEVVPYFNNLVAKFNASQSKVVVSHDFTSSLIAEFVRGNPPAIDCDNYNLTTSIFVARGVLADLAGLPQAKTIDPNIQALVTQYASFQGETSVLPYSVAAEGVI